MKRGGNSAAIVFLVFRKALIFWKILYQMYQHPSAIKALFAEIKAIDSNLDQETFTQRALLLLGQTKAGKTTLFYYLNGKQLLRQKNSIQVWQLVPEANFGNAIVGSNYNSTTVYPNISPFEEQGTIVIDMPGFDDDRHYLLLNIHILISTLRRLKQAHFCLVLPQDDCDSDSLIRELRKITNIFRQEVLAQPHNLSFILTKVEHTGAEEHFRQQIQEIIAAGLLEEVQPLLEASSSLKVYEFSTQEPRAEAGEQLRRKIIAQNSFFAIDNDPSTLLTDSCIQFMIGDECQSLQDYLFSILEDLQGLVISACVLCLNVVSFELSQFAGSAQNSQDLAQEMFGLIILNHLQLADFMLKKVQPKRSANKPTNVEKYMTVLECQQGAPLFPRDQFYILKTLQHLLWLLERIMKGETILVFSFLDELSTCLKTLTTMIELLGKLRLVKIQQRFEQIALKSSIHPIVEAFYLRWSNREIHKNPSFLIYSQIHCINNDSQPEQEQQIEEEIIKIQLYTLPKNKKIRQAIKLHKNILKPTENPQSTERDVSIDKLSYPQLVNHLKALPISANSLIFMLKLARDEREKMVDKDYPLYHIKTLLFQIAQQLQAFSFFEEAILFHLSTSSEVGVDALLEEGVAALTISQQFLEGVMIPYYLNGKKDLNRLSRCYDLLLSMKLSPKQLLKVEQEREKHVFTLMEANEKQLASEKRSFIEFCFVNYFLQNFEYLAEEARRKEKAFRQSPLYNLMSFISPE